MAQKLYGATGIVAVLILAGIFLFAFGMQDISKLAVTAGVSIGIILGILGIFGVIITLLKRIF